MAPISCNPLAQPPWAVPRDGVKHLGKGDTDITRGSEAEGNARGRFLPAEFDLDFVPESCLQREFSATTQTLIFLTKSCKQHLSHSIQQALSTHPGDEKSKFQYLSLLCFKNMPDGTGQGLSPCC